MEWINHTDQSDFEGFMRLDGCSNMLGAFLGEKLRTRAVVHDAQAINGMDAARRGGINLLLTNLHATGRFS